MPDELSALAADVRRVADRLRSASQAQLAAAAPPFASRAAAGRSVAQALAEAAQGLEEAEAAEEPGWRTLPELSDFAVGDMVAVTGHDLLAAAAEARHEHEIWTRAGRKPLGAVIHDLAVHLGDVRRLL